MEIRESNAEKASKVKCLSVWSPSDSKKIESIVNQALVLESGRCVARDIGKEEIYFRTHDQMKTKYHENKIL